MTLWNRIWNYFRVKSAIKYANKMHKISRKRYYVIKIFNKVKVYDRTHIDFLINEGILHNKLRDFRELQKFSLYFTK